jgi:hypothetical protein
MREAILVMLLCCSAECASTPKAVPSTSSTLVHSEYDKSTGISKLSAVLVSRGDDSRGQSMKIEREGQNPYVTLTYQITDSTDNIINELQKRRFELAANNGPLAHTEPAMEPVINAKFSNLTMRTTVPIEAFKKLGGATSFEAQLGTREEKLSDNELSIIKEFVKRLDAPPAKAGNSALK